MRIKTLQDTLDNICKNLPPNYDPEVEIALGSVSLGGIDIVCITLDTDKALIYPKEPLMLKPN